MTISLKRASFMKSAFQPFFFLICNNQIMWNHRQSSSRLLSLLFRAFSKAKLRLKGYACTAWWFSPGTLDLGKFFFFHSFLLFSLLLFFFPLLIIHVLIWSSQAVEKWQGSVIRPWALHWCTAMLEGLEWKRPCWLECKAHS